MFSRYLSYLLPQAKKSREDEEAEEQSDEEETPPTSSLESSSKLREIAEDISDLELFEGMNDLLNMDSQLLSGLNSFFGNLFRAAKDSYSLTEYNEQKRFYKEIVSKLIMSGLKHGNFDEDSKQWKVEGYQMGHQYPEKMSQLSYDVLCSRLTVAQQLEQQLQDKIAAHEKDREKQESRIRQLTEDLGRFQEAGMVLTDLLHKIESNPLMECAVCFRPYSRTIIPHIGQCGHSICKRCTKWIKKTDCPVCRSRDSFEEPIKNFLATELMSHLRNENPHALVEEDPFENEEPDYDNQQGVEEESDDDEGENILAEEQERLWAQILAENARRAQRQRQLAEAMAAAARPRTVEEDVAILVGHLVDVVVAREGDEASDDDDSDEGEEDDETGLPAAENQNEADGQQPAVDPVAPPPAPERNQNPNGEVEVEMPVEVPVEVPEEAPAVETGGN